MNSYLAVALVNLKHARRSLSMIYRASMAKFSMECPETHSILAQWLSRKLPLYSFSMYALQIFLSHWT